MNEDTDVPRRVHTQILSDALGRALKDDTTLGPAKGVISKDDLRKEAEARLSRWGRSVDEELRNYELDLEHLKEVETRIRTSYVESLDHPVGLRNQPLNAFRDKTQPGIEVAVRKRCIQNLEYLATESAIGQSREALVESLVERSVLPTLRLIINEKLTDDVTNNVLSQGDGSGLDQLLPPGFELQSDSRKKVEKLLSTLTTASIGVAGPRGSGKTTLLGWFCQRSSPQTIRILVSAPVKYEARDYLLFLLSAICRETLRAYRAPLELSSSSPRKVDDDWLGAYVRRLLLRGVGVAIGVVPLTLAGMWLIAVDALHLSSQVRGTISAAIAGAAISFGVHKIRIKTISPLRTLMLQKRPTDLSVYNRLSRSFRILGVLASVVVVGIGLRATYGFTTNVTAVITLLAGSTAILVMYVLAGSSPMDGWDVRPRMPFELQREIGCAERRSPRTELIREVRDTLAHVSFQQAASASRSDRVGVSAQLGITLSMGTTHQKTETRTALPWTRPEVTDEIRRLLRSITTRTSGIVIGIDELDKIDSPEEARLFIDDIKGVFGVPKCHFLVSVSEDALADFERRGMPFRNAFDSAFDDVVMLNYFSLEESSSLLRSRVVAMPMRFIALLHALAGGLPRDLLRMARRIYELELPIYLDRAAKKIVSEEVQRKVGSTDVSVGRLS